MTTEDHFNVLKKIWHKSFLDALDYLKDLDGETSRAIGLAVVESLHSDNSLVSSTANWLKGDSTLWHELANSRKK